MNREPPARWWYLRAWDAPRSAGFEVGICSAGQEPTIAASALTTLGAGNCLAAVPAGHRCGGLSKGEKLGDDVKVPRKDTCRARTTLSAAAHAQKRCTPCRVKAKAARERVSPQDVYLDSFADVQCR